MSRAPGAAKRFPIGLERLTPEITPATKTRRVVTPPVAESEPPVEAPKGHPRPIPAPAMSQSRVRAPVASPASLGAIRQRMVARLREDEPQLDARVLDALATVPRHAFVDGALGEQAYEDTALPIGHGQTISKPSTVARMLSLLFEGANARRLGTLGRALEVGTGCGYQAGLLSRMSPAVISVERVEHLQALARERLSVVREVRRTALRLVLGDGRLGHPPNAPYDSIVAAAVGDTLPQAWVDQLAVGGRLVMPQAIGGQQRLVVIDRLEHGVRRYEREDVCFVPLEFGVVRQA